MLKIRKTYVRMYLHIGTYKMCVLQFYLIIINVYIFILKKL